MAESARVPRKKKIAILGGGPSALAAAFELSRTPELRDAVEVTVYQLGWRLGGKCATGRGEYDRIEEHGIHILQGWYQNTFAMLREVFAERLAHGLDPDSPFHTVEQAFQPTNATLLAEFLPRRGWVNWPLVFPTNSCEPGIGDPPTMAQILAEVAELVLEIILGIDPVAIPHGAREGISGVMREAVRAAISSQARSPDQPTEIERWVHERLGGEKGGGPEVRAQARRALKTLYQGLAAGKDATAVVQGKEAHPRDHFLAFLRDLSGWLKDLLKLAKDVVEYLLGIVRRFVGCVLSWAVKALDDVVALLTDLGPLCDHLRRAVLLVDILLVNLEGLFGDVWDPETGKFDFHRINGTDYRAWMKKWGASDDVIYSAPIRFLYTGTFSNVAPDTVAGSMAAGTAICGALSTLAYKGSIVWMFRYGTGDTMIMPEYEVLKFWGVRFEFFRAVRDVVPGADGIERIVLGKQVDLKAGLGEYTPWFPAGPRKNIRAFPSHPLYDQIDPAQARELQARHVDLESPWADWTDVGTIELSRARGDFDHVVLAIPIAALPDACPSILADPRVGDRWQKMVANVKTTPTQAMQAWIDPSLSELGFDPKKWGLPNGSAAGTVTYGNPMVSWIDSSLVLPSETWPTGQMPQMLMYTSGVLEPLEVTPPYSDHGYPTRAKEAVAVGSGAWMQAYMGWYFPTTTTTEFPQGMDLSLLAYPKDPCAPWSTKLAAQWFSANVSPSERYTLAQPGSERFRMKAGDTGFDNLVVCGDWTDYGLDAGFVEGAVQSGMLAAEALREKAKRDQELPVTRPPKRSPDVVW